MTKKRVGAFMEDCEAIVRQPVFGASVDALAKIYFPVIRVIFRFGVSQIGVRQPDVILDISVVL